MPKLALIIDDRVQEIFATTPTLTQELIDKIEDVADNVQENWIRDGDNFVDPTN